MDLDICIYIVSTCKFKGQFLRLRYQFQSWMFLRKSCILKIGGTNLRYCLDGWAYGLY
uniref:Uncharacterized protein n=1 Tax=Rhizophora mucronata TaxID=61149 RepID=A0A2P2PM75_RHIMU